MAYRPRIDFSPQIDYLPSMISQVQSIISTMMMSLSTQEAEPVGM